MFLCSQYDLLDEEHKGLFKGVFDVAKAPGDAGALAHLKDVVDKHFKDEEVWQSPELTLSPRISAAAYYFNYF